MKILDKKDFMLLKKLVSLKQSQTKEFVSSFLEKFYCDIVETPEYIFAEGNIPIALIAHMDTVFEEDSNNRDFINSFDGEMWNPYGAGFDDKAGIFSIFKILEKGYLPHVIFTTDEERGSLGALKLIEDLPKHPFNDLKYLIELDRANDYDCVFYGCINQEFVDYIESFGFVQAFGTSSDVKHISYAWNIAGVNLSIGYKYQHSTEEILNINSMFETISKVEKMLEDASNLFEEFKYIT
ncbi:MAG: M20/M25/M40 family metallo-hydrolase [Methanobrevibacter sp.]|nr:M20/M25/M40 family metallo-hydrolase [Methanobrevibacter sp.]